MKNILIGFVTLILVGCASKNHDIHINESPDSGEQASLEDVDDRYGYSETQPIKVGAFENGPRPKFNSNHRIYFEKLRGPNGQSINYARVGSCCIVESKNSPFGAAPLDMYELSYDGLEKPLMIFINMYDYEKPRAPKGLTLVD